MTTTDAPPTLTADHPGGIAQSAATVKLSTRRRRGITIGVALGIAWLVIVVVLAVLADHLHFVRNYDQSLRDATNYRFGPGWDLWFGSDRRGRDIFARCVYGARLSLIIAVSSIVIGSVVGAALGMLAGYFRGWIDRVVSILTDALLAFPAIVIAILIVGRFDALQANGASFFGIGFGWLTRTWSITFVFALLSIAPITRIVRAQTLMISQADYVLAARSIGARTGRILWREIFPNVVPALVSVAFTGIAVLLSAEAGLAYLGYSVKSPAASWGLMISENREAIKDAWWATLFPCLMLFFTVLSFNVIGDWVAKRFDIKEAAI